LLSDDSGDDLDIHNQSGDDLLDIHNQSDDSDDDLSDVDIHFKVVIFTIPAHFHLLVFSICKLVVFYRTRTTRKRTKMKVLQLFFSIMSHSKKTLRPFSTFFCFLFFSELYGICAVGLEKLYPWTEVLQIKPCFHANACSAHDVEWVVAKSTCYFCCQPFTEAEAIPYWSRRFPSN